MNIPPSQRHFRAVRAALAAVVVAALVPAPAHALTDAERAEALIRDGVRLRAQDQTARALPLFEEAYQLSRSPRTAGQLGLCELELGHFVKAESHLAEALASPRHPWIAKNSAILKRQLEAARAGVGELVVTVSPPGADVALDGSPIDRSMIGAPIRLDKGPVEIEVRASGFEPARETVTIEGGQRESRAFRLVATPAVSSPRQAGLSPGPASGAADVGAPRARATDSRTGSAGAARLAAWITGGAAIGALALGTAEAFNAASKRDDFNNHTAAAGGVTFQDCGTASLSAACQPLKDSYDRALTWSVVGFAAAGALAATSAVLFVLSSPGHQGGTEVAGSGPVWACVPQPGVRGVGCALRF